MTRVSFDHFSGTPTLPEVRAAMEPWFGDRFSGTGAVHSGGVEARESLDEARRKTANLLNAASEEEIIFTSSGTEALNLAVKGCAWANQRRGKKIVLSTIEHPAVMQSMEFLEELGFVTTRVEVTSEGKIDPMALAEAIDDQTILVCVHAGHHDVGTIQDLNAIGNLVAQREIALLVDATYATGWMEIDVQQINASYVAAAPHRFGGPKGTGILYKQRRARLTPLIHGGAQELGWRAGTENIAGIVGVGVACEVVQRDLEKRIKEVAKLQQALWDGLLTRVNEIRLNGAKLGIGRLPNSLNFSVAGVEGEGVALSLDMKGFAITSGQACTTRASRIPPTLAAMRTPERFGPGTLIVSFGPENTSEEVERFLEIFPGVVERLREME